MAKGSQMDETTDASVSAVHLSSVQFTVAVDSRGTGAFRQASPCPSASCQGQSTSERVWNSGRSADHLLRQLRGRWKQSSGSSSVPERTPDIHPARPS